MANFTPEELEEILQQFFDVTGKRQYIGARYVPIFGRKNEDSIEWDNSAPYEPLTIVLYQGNSYTSRTYVPTGVPITDTHFWANTGNYNAQVELYRRETAQAVERVADWLEEAQETYSAKPFAFDTVADMQTYEGLYDGAICHTNGLQESGDGGAAYYTISSTGDIACQDGLYATEVNVSLSSTAIDEITNGETPTSEGVIDETGLVHFWENAKEYIGKGLSTDFIALESEMTEIPAPTLPEGHTTQGATFDGTYIYRTHHVSDASQMYLSKSTLDGTEIYDVPLLDNGSAFATHGNYAFYWDGYVYIQKEGSKALKFDASNGGYVGVGIPDSIVINNSSIVGLQMIQTNAPDRRTPIRCLVACLGGGANISIFTEIQQGVFTHFTTFKGNYSWYNRQSVSADDTFVYIPSHGFPEYGSDVPNMIEIYSLLGQYICRINLPTPYEKELEDIAVNGYTIYCFYSDGTVYALDATRYLANRARIPHGELSLTSANVDKLMLCTNNEYNLGDVTNGITRLLPIVPCGDVRRLAPYEMDVRISMRSTTTVRLVGERDSCRMRAPVPVLIAANEIGWLYLNYAFTGVSSNATAVHLQVIELYKLVNSELVSVAAASRSGGVTEADIQSFVTAAGSYWGSTSFVAPTAIYLPLNGTQRYTLPVS